MKYFLILIKNKRKEFLYQFFKMTTTRGQQAKRLCRSNAINNLHGIINTSELNEDEKNEIYDLLVKELGIELENITQDPEREEICVAVEIPECCICMEQIVCQEKTTSCGHKFHTSCIHRWCESNNNCPMCRTRNPIEIMEPLIIPTGNIETNINYFYNNINNNNNDNINNNNNYNNNNNNIIDNISNNIENPYINRNYNDNIINHIENTLYVNNYNTNMNYMRHSD